jgi:acyl-CoA synthetase (AMP-forming)/AMP-acid ligase II
LGVKLGDRVATLAWNTQGHVEAWYGIAGMGAVVHTLNPRLSPETLASMVRQAECRLLVVSASLAAMGVELSRLAPSISRMIVIDEAVDVESLNSPVSVILRDEMEGGAPVVWGAFDENAPAGLCFTSGTTGEPKGVVYTHRSSYLHTLRALQADVIGTTVDDRVLMVVPMFHANGWGLPFAAPACGASLILPGRNLDGASLARLIMSEGATIAVGVPTVWLGLVDHLDEKGGDVPTLKRIMVGRSPHARAADGPYRKAHRRHRADKLGHDGADADRRDRARLPCRSARRLRRAVSRWASMCRSRTRRATPFRCSATWKAGFM